MVANQDTRELDNDLQIDIQSINTTRVYGGKKGDQPGSSVGNSADSKLVIKKKNVKSDHN